MHTLVVLDPGHFHAALTLRERHPLVADEVFVYARPGPDVQDFLALLAAFNRRPERPTRWRPMVQTDERPLERLLAERRGDVAILAGRNDTKAAAIRRLHDAGLHVLADKPWLVGSEALDDLRHALAGPPLAVDIMTGRHDVMARLQRELVHEPDVFGTFRPDAGEPAITLESVHCLDKLVNGVPLVRPPWFFDVDVQGDGIVDIPSHLVDRVQWWLDASGDGDAALLSARRWPTPVSSGLFERVTGLRAWPPALRRDLVEGVLAYRGNGELRYRMGGIGVRLTSRWEAAARVGGGDTHRARLRGTRADVRMAHGAETGWQPRLLVEPCRGAHGVEQALNRAVGAWQDGFPGLAVVPAAHGFELRVPASLRSGHETHFTLVLDEFLNRVERGAWSSADAERRLAKYTLLARASRLARACADRGADP